MKTEHYAVYPADVDPTRTKPLVRLDDREEAVRETRRYARVTRRAHRAVTFTEDGLWTLCRAEAPRLPLDGRECDDARCWCHEAFHTTKETT